MPTDEQYVIPFHLEDDYRHMRTFALKVRGSSMNKKFPDGSHVVCIRMIDWGENPRDGDYVVVQRRNQHGLMEATVKLLRIDDLGKCWLWPESTDPEYQAPLDADGEDIEIWAIVISYQASTLNR